MRSALFGLTLVLCLIGAGLGTVAETDAQQRGAKLDSLFDELQTTKDVARGRAATAEIWQLWLKSGRDDTDALTGQAMALMAAGELAAARDILDKVVIQAPEYAEGWNKRATVLYLLGENDLSLVDIDKVLALEPRHFGALAGQGLIHIAAERWKAALASFRRAAAANPFLAERQTLIPALERKVEGEPL